MKKTIILFFFLIFSFKAQAGCNDALGDGGMVYPFKLYEFNSLMVKGENDLNLQYIGGKSRCCCNHESTAVKDYITTVVEEVNKSEVGLNNN